MSSLNSLTPLIQTDRAIQRLRRTLREGITPPEQAPLAEWAAANFRLSQESSSHPGLFKPLPYQVEPLNVMAPTSGYEQVVLMWASQTGKTQLLLALLAYIMARRPGPALMVQPTEDMAKSVSKGRITPMIRDTAILRTVGLKEQPDRNRGESILHREFHGGHLTLVGSNSPAGLASRPVKYLFLDETDRYAQSAGEEGNPAQLALARTRTFWDRKIIYTSTPTIADASQIEHIYKQSDQRTFNLPCPHCGIYQELIWENVEWPEDEPAFAVYRCGYCRNTFSDAEKHVLLKKGRWVPKYPHRKIAGFHLSELYSPWRSWGDLAQDWVAAEGDPERQQTFVNTSLARPYSAMMLNAVDEAALFARREHPLTVLPPQAAVITAGVDVQDNRVEISVNAWGPKEECWLLEHVVIPGKPVDADFWEMVDGFLLKQYSHPYLGPLPIHATAIDAGYLIDTVIRFCKPRWGRRIWPTRGQTGTRPIWPRQTSKSKGRGHFYAIGVDNARMVVTERLKIAQPGPGFIHLPTTVDEKFIQQLTAEFLDSRVDRFGRVKREWKLRPGRRNEAFDCAVYALAALHGLKSHGIDVDVESERALQMEDTRHAVTENEAEKLPLNRRTIRSAFLQ